MVQKRLSVSFHPHSWVECMRCYPFHLLDLESAKHILDFTSSVHLSGKLASTLPEGFLISWNPIAQAQQFTERSNLSFTQSESILSSADPRLPSQTDVGLFPSRPRVNAFITMKRFIFVISVETSANAACNLKAVSMEWFQFDCFTEVLMELEPHRFDCNADLPFYFYSE